MVVIHEIFGMSDWVQQLTDELAEAGYIAIAPDLLSGMGPNGGGTSSLEGNAVRQAIGALPPDQIAADLNARRRLCRRRCREPTARSPWPDTAGAAARSFRFATNRSKFESRLCVLR